MAYANAAAGVIRVKGRESNGTAAAELIPDPVGVTLSGLNVSTNSVGNVTLYAVGNDENIYSYTDTLNAAVSGVLVSNLTTAYNTTSMTPSSATISWAAMPNATDYFVVVDTEAWTNIYDAENASATVAAAVVTSANSYAFNQKFAPNNSYFVSVWALGNNTAGKLTTVSSLQGTNVISSFGGTMALNPPLQVPLTPVDLVPALDATISPVAPDFVWTSVTGATSYTLQITTASDPLSRHLYTSTQLFRWPAKPPATPLPACWLTVLRTFGELKPTAPPLAHGAMVASTLQRQLFLR